MKVKYTAHATATGGGREDGHAETDDGKVSVTTNIPKEMGGSGGAGTNPEQLFAVGFATCFLGAMHAAAGREKKNLPSGTSVTANVSFADREDNVGFTIVSELVAKVPGYSAAETEALMQAADRICPYAHALRNPSELKLTAAA